MIRVMLTGVSGRTGRRARARSSTHRHGGPARRRRWQALAVMAGIALLFYCAQRQARQMGVQSDGAAMELQSWSMLHGNLLLHGWYLSDVSFYTTELPEYTLVELVRGLNPDVVRLCAALTYTLLVVLAAAVAYGAGRPTSGRPCPGRDHGRGMLGPTAAATTTLLNDPDHTGTAVPILLVLLVLDRARAAGGCPLVVAAVLGWALVGDSLVLLIGVAPLVVVGGARSFGLVALRRAAALGRPVRALAGRRRGGGRDRRDGAERADQGERRLRGQPEQDAVRGAVRRDPGERVGDLSRLPQAVQRRFLRRPAEPLAAGGRGPLVFAGLVAVALRWRCGGSAATCSASVATPIPAAAT